MFLQFSVTNFKSIRNTAVVNFEATPDKTHQECLISPNEKQKLLPVIAVYGANSSGKSNLLQALSRMMSMITGTNAKPLRDTDLPYEPFAFADNPDGPTTFEVFYFYEGIKYNYGFSYDRRKIVSEYLYYWPNRRESLIFRRENETYKFMEDISEQKTLAGRTPENRLYLVVSNEWNNKQTAKAYQWFTRKLMNVPASANDNAMTTEELLKSSFRKKILKELLIADLGIVDVRIPTDDNGQIVTIHRIQREGSQEKMYPLLLSQESQGTRRYFSRIGYWMKALHEGGVLFVDELEASMHPLLTRHLIEVMMDKETNPNQAQLFFTTHDVGLLDQKLLRRDQIWFTEKNDKTAETEVFALTDFSVRKDENIEKGYMLGRYGAVPFIGMEE